MTKGERIKFLREKKGLSQVELANKIDVSKQNLYKYENDIITNIPSDKIELLAQNLGVSPSYIMGWEDSPTEEKAELGEYGLKPIKKRKFRILGEIACGEPIYCEEDYETYIEASDDINADFCLIAKGDSMVNARIYNGDVVFIKEKPLVNNGEIAAVIIDNEATLKRVYYYRDENKLVLSAENPKYSPLVYVNDELNSIRILGRATAFMSYVK